MEPLTTPLPIQTVRIQDDSIPEFIITIIHYSDQEQLKEWSNVLNVSLTKTAQNTPQSGYTQSLYGDGTAATAQLVGYSAQGVGHTVPIHQSMDLAFFGIA